MNAVLEVRHLGKDFGDVVAVRDISFEITEGTCFGLLGPNGAGKTTTVEILEGIGRPTRGEVLYRGRPLSRDFTHDAGIMFQHTALQDFMTVREALQMFGRFYRKTVPVATLIEWCALHEFLDRDTRNLSGGQKQRLLLAIALVNDPDVLFLDEPTTGLDPQARRNFWHLLQQIKASGKTVVLTTHYMEEAAVLCDQLVFVDHGSVIAAGSPSQLLATRYDDVILRLPPAALPVPLPEREYHSVRNIGTQLEIHTRDVNRTLRDLLALDTNLAELRIRERNLEDLFLELTGEALRS